MEITVSGEHYVEVAPEFARLHLAASANGTDKQRAASTASDLGNQLAASLAEAHARNVVVEPLRVNSWVDGRKTSHSASVALRAEFVSPDELAAFQARWAGVDGVELGWVSWELGDEASRSREAEVIAGALDAARRRARHIADAAGKAHLEIVQVADPGLMGSEQASYGGALLARSAKTAAPVEIRPENVRVSARLDVRFRAG